MTLFVAPVPLTLKVHPRMAEGLRARGAAMGNMTGEAYAGLLLEAAYAARIGRERGEAPADRDLDAMVRLVLACAGAADTATIATFLGIPEATVERVLAGWRLAAGGTPARPKAPAASPPARRHADLTDMQMQLFLHLAETCGNGEAAASLKRIGAALGVSEQSMHNALKVLVKAGLVLWTAGNGRIPARARLTDAGKALSDTLMEERS